MDVKIHKGFLLHMKIYYVIDYLHSVNGGTERQLFMLIEGMVSRGHQVDLYVFRDTKFTKDLVHFPCPVHCLNIDSILSPSGIRRLLSFRKKIVTDHIDVLHGFFNDVALTIPPLIFGTRVTAFTSRRDMGIWYSPTRLFFLRIFRSSRIRLICNSMAVAKLTSRKEWKSHNSIHVIYNGMDKFTISHPSVVFDWVPQKGKNINVILVANVRPIKRIEDLVRAAIFVVEHGIRPKYYIIGELQDDRYFNSICKLLKESQLEKDFHFTGPIIEPRNYLTHFDIGVLTSESEGFSNTLMEYLDAGLPVVASRVGGNPELVSDGNTGFLYEAGDAKALAECMLNLISNEQLRFFFTTNAKTMITNFDRKTMIENHEKEYLCVL
jgi:L-malate glycosyltransferase